MGIFPRYVNADSVKVTTGPVIEPVTLDEVKLQARITTTAEDDLINGYITTARIQAEAFLNLKLLTQTLQYNADYISNWIKLPWGNVQSISSITYKDSNEVSQTLPSADYVTDLESTPARIMVTSIPDVSADTLNNLTITYICGFGDQMKDVPQNIKTAIKLRATELYNSRSESTYGTIRTRDAEYFNSLLLPHRVTEF